MVKINSKPMQPKQEDQIEINIPTPYPRNVLITYIDLYVYR